MSRFANSNRHAAGHMIHSATKRIHHSPAQRIEQDYFRRIGFDLAMI